MGRLWSYFSKIIIITIPNSDQNRIKNQLKFIGMDNYEIRVFKPAKKTSNNCGGKNSISLKQLLKHEVCDTTCQNIANNHFTIIQEAFDNNYENILIMEDDVIFQSITDRQLFKTISWLSSHNWDIFYFGYCPWPILFSIPVYSNILKVFTPLLGHCYALSNKGIKKIMKTKKYYRYEHIDKFYATHNFRKFALFPCIAFQKSAPGLYDIAMDKLGVDIPFDYLTKSFEILSLLTPMLLLMIIIFIIYKFINFL